MIWERLRWRLAVGSAAAYQCLRPEMTVAKICLRRPKGAVTVVLKLL